MVFSVAVLAPTSRWLLFPRALWLALLLRVALWLPWPLLTRGKGGLDELWIAAVLSERPALGAMTRERLFQFADGVAAHLHVERGPVPWFAHPDLKIALWRPLTELTHRLDHAVFGVVSQGAYVHSFLWSVALLIMAKELFERVLSPRVAGLSLLVLALAGSHNEPTNWVVARNSVVCAVFGFAALVCHVDWREQRGGWRRRAASVLLFALALLGGEAAFGVLAFFVAYEAVVVEEPWPRRMRAVAPVVFVCAAWLAAYVALGFGTHASGLYLNPLNEPFEFLREAPARMLALVAGGLTEFPTVLWAFRPELRPLLVGLGISSLIVTAIATAPAWRHASPPERRRIAWLAFAGALALVPQAGGTLGARSVLVSTMGIAPVVGFCFMYRASGGTSAVEWLHRIALGVVALAHFVFAPLNWWGFAATYRVVLDREAAALARNDLTQTSGRHTVLLACPDPKFAFYMPMKLAARGVTPTSWNVLSAAYADHRVRRTGPSTLELEVMERGHPEAFFEQFFRSSKYPLRPGERVPFGVATAEVLEMRHHVRARVAFTFERPLDDPSLYFAAWTGGALRRIELPQVGQSIDLPFEVGPWMLQ